MGTNPGDRCVWEGWEIKGGSGKGREDNRGRVDKFGYSDRPKAIEKKKATEWGQYVEKQGFGKENEDDLIKYGYAIRERRNGEEKKEKSKMRHRGCRK